MSFIGSASLSLFKPVIRLVFWACAPIILNPISCPPSSWLKRASAVLLHGSGVTSTWLLGDGLIGVMSPSNVL